MPYYNEYNLLFIHIPKTGGSNIENFFFSYSKKKPVISNLCSNNINLRINNHSLQHMTYKEILSNKDFFNIDFNNIKIITVVRNPYDRILSDLFYLKFAHKNNNSSEIEEIIKNYLNNGSITRADFDRKASKIQTKIYELTQEFKLKLEGYDPYAVRIFDDITNTMNSGDSVSETEEEEFNYKEELLKLKQNKR